MKQANEAPQITYTEEAKVEVTIYPRQRGRVKFQGSWWAAYCSQEVVLRPGEIVRVVGTHNITLLVEPINLSSSMPLFVT